MSSSHSDPSDRPLLALPLVPPAPSNPLIVGGCKPGNAEETACFDQWLANMVDKLLEQPTADTIVMLAVGHGVLELSAIKLLLQTRAEANGDAIKHIVLIDPYTPPEVAQDVTAAFADQLLGVDTRYFAGGDAYQQAHAMLRDEKTSTGSPMRVAIVGAINYGLLFSLHERETRIFDGTVMLLQLLILRQRDNDPIWVVQAFRNARNEYVHRVQTAAAFLTHTQNEFDAKKRLLASF